MLQNQTAISSAVSAKLFQRSGGGFLGWTLGTEPIGDGFMFMALKLVVTWEWFMYLPWFTTLHYITI
jgi:hypothetical protein